ncbi:MAG: DNA-directed RNA polymerase subunit alpha [Chloroflexi bacterium RBG_13_51_36]|nr:MAG: DNA-directed RNA polymerase subunit alpha [Chloroflexi bacterium RBG_13_51_36]
MPELSVPTITCAESSVNYGRFLAEPLEPGFGITLGNALRRVLLSCLPGAAVTWVRIEGIQHEFSPIPHVKEDAMEFLLNIRQLRLCPLSRQPGQLVLDVQGEGKVCAADIKPSTDFRVANPELHLASLDSSKARLYVELNVELGRGYVPARSANGLPVGALPVDAIFTPVRKVNFSVESIKPGQEGSPEKLVLEIWTDGTILPWEALNQSAIVLINQFSSFRDFEVPMARVLPILPEQYDTPLEELNLSTRSYNSLKRAGIFTLGQLMEKGREGLPPLPGLGAKSRAEVEELMARLGSPIAEKKKE